MPYTPHLQRQLSSGILYAVGLGSIGKTLAHPQALLQCRSCTRAYSSPPLMTWQKTADSKAASLAARTRLY